MLGWRSRGTISSARGIRKGRGLVFAAAAVLAASATALGQELNSQLESLISSSRIGAARVGVSVVDLQTGRTLAEIDGNGRYIPASNMKVLTTGAALHVLGDEFVFRTELILDERIAGTAPRLIVRGSGDPALGDPAILDQMSPRMSVQSLVGAMAGAVKAAGVDHVSEIIVDERIFDRDFVHELWPRDQLDRWYCAPVAGVNFNTNVISFFPGPGAEGPGSPPSFTVEPNAWWLEVDNRAQTSSEGNNSVWFTRASDANRFTMYGQVRLPSSVPIRVTIHEPPTLVGQLIGMELPKAGVAVADAPGFSEGRGRLSRAEQQSVTGAVRLARPEERFEGRPVAAVTTHIRDIVTRCNRDSQNMYAEALLKRLGHEVTQEPGSWKNGASVLRMTISELLGPDHAAMTVVSDGSGLSRENLVSPRTMTAWLRAMAEKPASELFIESLASPGDGTLRRRFGNANLRNSLQAKSGRINGVRCLSGYLTDADGRRIAFSILVNDLREGEQALNSLKLHEEIVVSLDRWLSAQRPRAAAQ